MFRWIKEFHHYLICHLDTSLPKDDLNQDQREIELEDKRRMYELVIKVQNLPIQVGHKYDNTCIQVENAILLKQTVAKLK